MSIEIKDLMDIDKKEITISDLSKNEINKIYVNDMINIPIVRGEKGEKGDKGDKGEQGANGTNGQDGVGVPRRSSRRK